jgi:D-xylulose 5-phosphate/D-fructose 6-phosphate phosphoketolase
MEVLSEHTCQGRLEGYLLTGRHGLFSCYEAFVHIVVHGQPAHQVAACVPPPAVARADRLAELAAHLARVTPDPNPQVVSDE